MELKKLMFFGVFATVLLCSEYASSANILVVTFFSTKSNKITYMRLIEKLASRGHNITLVSPIKPFKEIPNVKEIYTLDVDKIFHNNEFNPFNSKEKEEIVNPMQMLRLIGDVCNQTYDLPQVQNLLNEKFDLVFHHFLFNECILGLIHRLQAPHVLFTPTGVPTWTLSNLGGYYPSSITPNFLTDFGEEMTFSQRFVSFAADLLVKIFIEQSYEPMMEQIYREKLGQDIPSIGKILRNASLTLSNRHFSLTGPMAFLPDIIDIGGVHSKPAKPVPKDMEDFIQMGKDGFILFSMGSAIKGDMMPEYKRKMILNVFSKLKQQVLWKWESETMPDLPKNVKLSKWLPQQDLLGHKDIKMFITHCGGGSTEEAIYHGVPLVGLPMTADQPANAKLAKKHGTIVTLDWNDMTQEDFQWAIEEILNNPKYRDNVKKLSALFKDRPVYPLDLGVYWIEYVIRHGGAPHLRSAGRKLNYFQYQSYDVIGAYLLIIVTILYSMLAALRFTLKKLFCKSKLRSHVSTSKKTN